MTSKLLKLLIFYSCILLCVQLRAQDDLRVQYVLPSNAEERLSICGDEREHRVVIENISTNTLSDVSVNLNLPAGIFYVDGSSSSPDGITQTSASPPSFDAGDFVSGEIKILNYYLDADCNGLDLATGGTSINYATDYTYMGGNGSQSNMTSPNFELLKPTLSFPNIMGNFTSGNVLDADLGSIDTLTVELVNGNNGSLRSLTYCIYDGHPQVEFRGLSVNNINIPVTYTDGDTLYFVLDQTIINEAMPFLGNAVQDPDLFQFNEMLIFKEAWETVDCPGADNAPDILRKAFYGCDDTNPCEETSPSFTGVRFGFKGPSLWAGDYTVRLAADIGSTNVTPYRDRDEYSDCYKEDTMSHSYAFINTGDAVLLLNDFDFNLHRYGYLTNFQFLENAVTYHFKDGATTTTPVTITPDGSQTQAQRWGANAWWLDECFGDGSGAIRLDFRNEGILIPPGDTLIVKAPFVHAPVPCGQCLETAHTVFTWPMPQADEIVYSDQCQSLNFSGVAGGSSYWNRMFIRQFPEGNANIYPGEEHTLTYPTAGAQWHIKNARCTGVGADYPYRDHAYINSDNAYVEFMYVLPEGIDWAGADGDLNTNAHQYIDIQGDVYPNFDVEYIDNNSGNDTLFIRYKESDPVCFDNLNSQFILKTVADCSEASTPFCDKTVTYQKHSHYVTECTSDGELCKERIDVRRDFNVSIHNCDCNPCEGIAFNFSEFERTNFGGPDSNNDGIDEGGTLDSALVAKKRFLPGDTLRATYGGRVNLITRPHFDTVYSVVQIPVVSGFGDEGITPLGADVTIYDNSTGDQYTCSLIPQFMDGSKVVSNLTASNLLDLGCPLPAGFVYEQDDSIAIDQYFRVQDYSRTAQLTVNFGCEFYASDAEYNMGNKFQCNTQGGSMTYITYRAYNDWLERTVTGCNDGGNDVSAWRDFHRSQAGIGGRDIDEFPFEIRKAFTPKQQIFVNNSDLEWGQTFTMRLSDYNGYLTATGGTLDAQEYAIDIASSSCIVITGDTLTVDLECAYADVGFERFDEGLLLYSTPHLSPTCRSEYTAPSTFKDIDAITLWDVNEGMFGSPELIMQDTSIGINENIIDPWNNAQAGNYIFSDESIQSYDFVQLEGLPNVQLVVTNINQTLEQEDACFEIDITNFGDAIANNVYFTFENTSGAVIVQEVRDRNTNAVLPFNLGVVQLGTLAAGEIRNLELCVTSNNCMSDSLQVNTGWDCGGYPFSSGETECTDPTTIYLDIPNSELGMIIQSPDPGEDFIANLCSEIEYIVQLSSSDVGYINDIEYFFWLPPGHDLIDGSFEIAYPVPLDGSDTTWVTTTNQPQPRTNGGNTYSILLDPENPVLADEGLVGTTNTLENFFLVRFRTFIGCGVVSGSRVRMYSKAENPCDQLANYRFSPGPRVRVAGVSNTYISQLDVPSSPVLNACTNNEIPIDIEFSLEIGSLPTGSGDSIMVQLPDGIEYVPDSYTPGSNSLPPSATNPYTQQVGDAQYLFIDLQDGVTAGQSVQLSFDIRAIDVGQDCREYEFIVNTFNAQELVCQTTGELCNVRNVSDELPVPIIVEKPDLFIDNLSATLSAQPPSQEQLNFCLDVTNVGADINAGTVTTISFYNDNNSNGDVEPGIDDFLGNATFMDEVLNGQTVTVCDSTLITAGLSCNLIAFIDPEVTCACNANSSFRVEPEFEQVISPRAYTVCSDEAIMGIGPEPLDNVTYEWVGIDGASTVGFSSSTTTPVDFQFRNTTGSTINWSYYLRSVRNNDCVSLDTVRITIHPEEVGSVSTQVCNLGDFTLSAPLGNTNYLWSPAAGLSDPTAPAPSVDVDTYGIGRHIFTVSYTDVNGCVGTFETEVIVVECAPTYIGNYVWCDDNRNGIQDDSSPLQGFVVELFNGTDPTTPIATTLTDASGFYQFGPLPQGEYIVGLDLLGSNYQLPPKDATDDENDSDLNANFQTDPVFLTLGDSLMNVDLAVWCPEVDLELTKEIFGDMTERSVATPVEAGDIVWWKIELCNRALSPDTTNFDADSIYVTEALPDEVLFVSAVTSYGTYDQATNTWFVDRLTNGTCETLWLQTQLLDSAICAVNYVQISSAADPDIDSTPGNGGDPLSITEDDEGSAKIPDEVFDYGDLPDVSGGIGTGDYQTLFENNGPSHKIVEGLFFGVLIDEETDGSPSIAADGDGATDDGTSLNTNLDIIPGNTLNLPLRITNLTDSIAHLEVWVDWNGDGDFNDPGEMIMDLDDSVGGFPPITQVMVPSNAILNQNIGVRYRLSNTDSMTPYGRVFSGEVEDYLIRLNCVPKSGMAPVELLVRPGNNP